MLRVDSNGFDALDRKLLMTMIENFDGGPVVLIRWRRRSVKNVAR